MLRADCEAPSAGQTQTPDDMKRPATSPSCFSERGSSELGQDGAEDQKAHGQAAQVLRSQE